MHSPSGCPWDSPRIGPFFCVLLYPADSATPADVGQKLGGNADAGVGNGDLGWSLLAQPTPDAKPGNGYGRVHLHPAEHPRFHPNRRRSSGGPGFYSGVVA